MIKLGVRLSKEGIPVPIDARTGEDIGGLLKCQLSIQAEPDEIDKTHHAGDYGMVKMTITVFVHDRDGAIVQGPIEDTCRPPWATTKGGRGQTPSQGPPPTP